MKFSRLSNRASDTAQPISDTLNRKRQAAPPATMAALCPLTPLITQTAARNVDAFHRLYEETSPQVYGIVCHLVTDRMAAEEVLIDTYLVVWATAARFITVELTAMAWLSANARRCSVAHLRDQLRLNQARVAHDILNKIGTGVEQIR